MKAGSNRGVIANAFRPQSVSPDDTARVAPQVARSDRAAGSLSGLSALDTDVVQRVSVRPPRCSATKVQAVTSRAPLGTSHQLTSIEAQIARTFVRPEHLCAISAAARSGAFAVSFRASGELTLKRLASGAPAKGHDILEKTIKPSSLQETYGADAQRRLAQIERADIDGYVGHWADDKLLGLYMGPTANERDTPALLHALKSTPSGQSYYPVNHDDLEGSLALLKNTPGPLGTIGCFWKSLPYTGDYDMHDMLNMAGHRAPVASGSRDEHRIMKTLNVAIGAIDPVRTASSGSHRLIQHGPQYNYIAHMRVNEPGAMIHKAMAQASFPLAMCDRGTWSVIETPEELEAFYRQHGVVLKEKWRPELSNALRV
ncbi:MULTISPECIES: hypothetical protein [Burkholderia]|uniref:hypothetical protein n=1 Tax=Burkholderia TaxID=32008 RepID=UPI00158C4A96|nr:hypothetical protein [Burkholderia sp. BKH01]